MTIEEIFNEYYTTLDNLDKSMADSNVAEKGIDKFLSQQLIYLDCSRILQGMRMMQTIGYPYRRELMIFFYVLDKAVWTDGKQDEHHKEWSDKLIALHEANLKYEEINPPVWYGGKKAKEAVESKTVKTPRRRKSKEQTLPSMDKEVKAQATLKAKLAGYANISFKIKPLKKD